MAVRFLKKYKEEIIKEISETFSIKNVMAVPRVEKIVVNMGVGQALQDIKILEKAMVDMATITGQKPLIRRAKKAISNFKLRQGNPIGCKVTLRQTKMYEFMDRLMNVALPRIRDFNGVPRTSFDKGGNYTLGIKDQSIFPEVEVDREHRTNGMDITFVFNHGPKEQTMELLRLFGMPFEKERERE